MAIFIRGCADCRARMRARPSTLAALLLRWRYASNRILLLLLLLGIEHHLVIRPLRELGIRVKHARRVLAIWTTLCVHLRIRLAMGIMLGIILHLRKIARLAHIHVHPIHTVHTIHGRHRTHIPGALAGVCCCCCCWVPIRGGCAVRRVLDALLKRRCGGGSG